MRISDHTKGILLIILSAICFGSYGVWSRWLGESFGTLTQSWTKGVLSIAILLPILFVRKEIIKIKREDCQWFAAFLLFIPSLINPFPLSLNPVVSE